MNGNNIDRIRILMRLPRNGHQAPDVQYQVSSVRNQDIPQIGSRRIPLVANVPTLNLNNGVAASARAARSARARQRRQEQAQARQINTTANRLTNPQVSGDNEISGTVEPVSLITHNVSISSHATYMGKLYKDGTSSDVEIEFLCDHFEGGMKILKLHKIILRQSPYFEALFNSQWAEADKDKIQINVTDDNITERSIDIVFRSLYTSNLIYESNEEDLISILATARMFTCDEIADIIVKQMEKIVGKENVVYFYYSFGSYGYPELEEEMLQWILRNFSYWQETAPETFNAQVLNKMEMSLLEKLITHPNFVIKNEFKLYETLKRWAIDKMKTHGDYDFFKVFMNKTVSFLESPNGQEFERLFSLLNLNYIQMEPKQIETLITDNIFPRAWLERAGAENYMNLMKMSSGLASQNNGLDDEYRVGIFHADGVTFQPLSIYFFGIHLKFAWIGRILAVQRCRREQELLFNHSPVELQFGISFYTPEKFTKDDDHNSIHVSHHKIYENELINLAEWNTGESLPQIPSGQVNYIVPRHFNNQPFMSISGIQLNVPAFQQFPTHYAVNRHTYPKIIGIRIKYVGINADSIEVNSSAECSDVSTTMIDMQL